MLCRGGDAWPLLPHSISKLYAVSHVAVPVCVENGAGVCGGGVAVG